MGLPGSFTAARGSGGAETPVDAPCAPWGARIAEKGA